MKSRDYPKETYVLLCQEKQGEPPQKYVSLGGIAGPLPVVLLSDPGLEVPVNDQAVSLPRG